MVACRRLPRNASTSARLLVLERRIPAASENDFLPDLLRQTSTYPDQSLVDSPIASLSTLPNVPYSLSPLPVSLPVLTSITGQPLAANGNTKSVPPNTPINYAPFAAAVGPLIGDWPSDLLRNGYTISFQRLCVFSFWNSTQRTRSLERDPHPASGWWRSALPA